MSVTPRMAGACAALAAAAEEDAFWREHAPLLMKRHPDQFVAVVKDRRRHDYGTPVAADSDLVRLIGKVQALGLDVTRVSVRFMAATLLHLAL